MDVEPAGRGTPRVVPTDSPSAYPEPFASVSPVFTSDSADCQGRRGNFAPSSGTK